MKNCYIFLRWEFYILFAFSAMFLFLVGCRSHDFDTEDVSNHEPYSQFIGVKYKLKRNCYLAISTIDIDIPTETNIEEVNSRNEFAKSYYELTGIKIGSENKLLPKIKSSDYYIVACGKNESPLELDEKYIGKEIRGGKIAGILPKGSEFIVKKIILVYYDGNLVITSPYVEITSNGITANAHLLVRGEPYTLVFEWRYVERVTPEPENK